MQSTCEEQTTTRLHVGIIMDGNGRWATARGRRRTTGHRAGARALRATVEAAPRLGVGTLTVFAFSSDNWARPPAEVLALHSLFERYLRLETRRAVENGVRLSAIGRRDRLPANLLRAILASEAGTCGGDRLHLRLAIDYSARDAILAVAQRLGSVPRLTREAFSDALASRLGSGAPAPDVDVLIRTGGEQRLSDFLLWESAYAELFFTPLMWPDFGPPDLQRILGDFARRERRFGRVPEDKRSSPSHVVCDGEG